MVTVKVKRFFFVFLFLFVAVFVYAQADTKIILINPLNEERQDELIVLSKITLEKKLGKIEDGKFVSVKFSNNLPLVVQYDDMNGDGKWDEVAFLYSFKAKEKVSISIALIDSPAYFKGLVRAHVRLRKKNKDNIFGPSIMTETMPLKNPPTDFNKQPLPMYLTEGPAWENDKVAFRQYFDTRNGRDIFGKRVPYMVMDSVGVTTGSSYHNLHNWGMDILHVGKSLGAGAVALQVKINGLDTLIRLGGEGVTETTYSQVSDGPVRAIFKIKYNWLVNGTTIKIVDETSIWGGQYFYQSKLIINNAPAGAKLVEGIADFNKNISKHFIVNNEAVIFSHGKQSENKDELGMGLIVSSKNFAGFGVTPSSGSDVTNSYTVAENILQNEIIYRFYAGWVYTDSRFASADYFEKLLINETKKMNAPILILFN